MRYASLAALLLLIAPSVILAQSPPTIFEFDPGVTFALDLNKLVRFDFATGREKSDELASSRLRAAGGISFRLKPFRKTLFDLIDTDKQHRYVLGIGYEFSRTSEPENRVEHRMILEGTYRNTLPAKLLLTNRNRFELRWVDNGFHWRYRNRLMFERPFRFSRLKLTPFGSAEAIWDQRYDKWNTFKFIGAVQVRLIRHTSLDIQYERQHCVVCSDPNTNIFGLTLNIYFLRKK
jgi:hypothetical protein